MNGRCFGPVLLLPAEAGRPVRMYALPLLREVADGGRAITVFA